MSSRPPFAELRIEPSPDHVTAPEPPKPAGWPAETEAGILPEPGPRSPQDGVGSDHVPPTDVGSATVADAERRPAGWSSVLTDDSTHASNAHEPTEDALSLIYRELHRLAQRRIREQQPGHTLQATALVNEAFLRLFGSDPSSVQNQDHFIARAASAMRSVLIDHARRKNRDKRRGVIESIPLDSLAADFSERAHDLLALDEALNRLASFDPRMSKVVELRFFGGLDMTHIARILGTSRRTAEREFQMAREWLRNQLTGEG